MRRSPPAGAPQPTRRCRPGLGSFVEIALHGFGAAGRRAVRDADRVALGAAFDAAFGAVARVEASMSFHDPRSDLSRLNRHAHQVPQRVDASTYEVLSAARDLFIATDGRFDCAVGAHLVRWALLPDHDAATDAATAATFADVDLRGDCTVAYRRPMRLDLGGIAKGYAVDRAIDALRAAGITDAVVNAGGDLRVLGATPHAVHVRDPADPLRLRYAGALADGAIATSAVYGDDARLARRASSALVDPIAGRALRARRSYSVIAPTCLVADALTKAVAVADGGVTSFLAPYGAHAIVL